MNKRKTRLIISSLISGLLLTLCQALPWDINLGFLAWAALVPMAVTLKKATQGERFIVGVTAGAAHYLTLLYWLVYTLNTYGNLNLPGSVSAALLLVALETAYLVFFALIFGWVTDRIPNAPTTLTLPILWIMMEFLRAQTPFGGFPWALLGYSQGYYTIVAQIADLTGVWGVGFIVALVNGALSDFVEWSFNRGKSAPWRQIAAAAFLVIVTLIYGAWRVNDVEKKNQAAKPIVVAALQGDIRQDMKWDKNSDKFIMSRYLNLQTRAIRDGAKLVVWPEAATPFAFERDMDGVALARYLASTGVYTLLGSVDYTVVNERRKFTNSAYLVGADGIQGKYSKIHLVPFSEYIPFVKYLGFIDKIVKGAAGNFSTGAQIQVFQLPEGKFSVIICYEAIFGNLTRRSRKAGAELLVNITNDAWFGDTSAPRHHLAMAAFRCVENHCWMVRAANTGISAVIDPLGRVVETTDVFTEAMIVREARLLPEITPYARYGDVFLYVILFVFAAGMIWIIVTKKEGTLDETGN